MRTGLISQEAAPARLGISMEKTHRATRCAAVHGQGLMVGLVLPIELFKVVTFIKS